MHNVRMTHKDTPVEKIPEAMRALKSFVVTQSIEDYVFLGTCNRAELYYLDGVHHPPEWFVHENGTEAFRHLLRVACGLESFVVGETEILNQVKRALTEARTRGRCSKELMRYFTDALRVGRKARKLTKISAGKVSIVSLALEHVRGLLGDLTRKRFLVVGAGELGAKVARSLKNTNVEKILISNRNYPKALALAQEIGGSAYRLSRLRGLMGGVDCVFCATNAPHPILTADKLEAAKKGLILVDLSVPRNVDGVAPDHEKIRFISFEHLIEKANENLNQRANEVKQVEALIDRELMSKGDGLRDLYVYAERVREEEVKRALRSLGSKTPEETIEAMSRSIVKKLYHPLGKQGAKRAE